MSPGTVSLLRRNLAFRVAFAATLGLLEESLRGALVPMLAPILAVQLLLAFAQPPGAKQVLGALLFISGSASLAYFVASLSLGVPGLYAIGIGLLFLVGFTLAFQLPTPALGSLFLTMTIAVTALTAASSDLGLFIVWELIRSVVVGFALLFLAFVLFPPPSEAATPEKPAAAPHDLPVFARALLATLILLPLQLYLVSDGVAALVILLTTMSMLMQPGLAESTRYSATFLIGNAAGSMLAAVSVLILALHDSALLSMAVVAAATLVLAAQIVRGPLFAAVFVPGLVAYLVLFGLTRSPLPVEDVPVIGRVLQVLGASLYALAAISVATPVAHWLVQRSGARRRTA